MTLCYDLIVIKGECFMGLFKSLVNNGGLRKNEAVDRVSSYLPSVNVSLPELPEGLRKRLADWSDKVDSNTEKHFAEMIMHGKHDGGFLFREFVVRFKSDEDKSHFMATLNESLDELSYTMKSTFEIPSMTKEEKKEGLDLVKAIIDNVEDFMRWVEDRESDYNYKLSHEKLGNKKTAEIVEKEFNEKVAEIRKVTGTIKQ